MATECPIFGDRQPGQYYQPRPGSYAVIRNNRGEVGIIETLNGFYLPGGGADVKETPEQTLHRELWEECAANIEVGKLLGIAIELVFARGEGFFEKICTFFEATTIDTINAFTECDHRLVWLPPQQAIEVLRHESQRWAVGLSIPIEKSE